MSMAAWSLALAALRRSAKRSSRRRSPIRPSAADLGRMARGGFQRDQRAHRMADEPRLRHAGSVDERRRPVGERGDGRKRRAGRAAVARKVGREHAAAVMREPAGYAAPRPYDPCRRRAGKRPPAAPDRIRGRRSRRKFRCRQQQAAWLKPSARRAAPARNRRGCRLPPRARPTGAPFPRRRRPPSSCSASICWCVVLAGWMTSVLASPTLARWLASRTASMNLRPAARPPLMPKLTIEPAPFGNSLRQRVIGMACERRVQHPFDRLVLLQEGEHRAPCSPCAAPCAEQRLDALQQVEGVGRRQARAEIAQALGARPHDEGRGAELLGEDEAVIAGVRLGHRRDLPFALPVEPAAVDDRAADGDAVAADPFGDRVHDEVGAEFDRPAEIGRRERVVDQERHAGRVRDLRDAGMSSTSRPGLPIVSPITSRVFSRIAARKPRVARLDERRGDAEARQRLGQQIDRAAVERGRGDDVVAGAEQRRDGEMHRRHAARRADRADPPSSAASRSSSTAVVGLEMRE